MTRRRDFQRSLVYAWESAHTPGYDRPTMTSLDEVETFANAIWKKERGRYGHAKRIAPTIRRQLRGVRRGFAHVQKHELVLPRWARSEYVILHEIAHLLTPGDRHGPRFVGALIGLLCRYLARDANELMALADEMNVKYRVGSIGSVPIRPTWVKIEERLPATDMELAFLLDLSYKQVRGAALHLIKVGRARWFRGKLIKVQP